MTHFRCILHRIEGDRLGSGVSVHFRYFVVNLKARKKKRLMRSSDTRACISLFVPRIDNRGQLRSAQRETP